MLSFRALATFFIGIVLGIALPVKAQVAFGHIDPARGFDNPPSQEEVQPREEPVRLDSSYTPESTRTGFDPPARPFVFVPPPEPDIAVFPAAPRPVSDSFGAIATAGANRTRTPVSAEYISPMVLPEPQLAIMDDTTLELEPLSKAVERALATSSMVDTPFTAEVDALEAARRARQSGVRVAAAGPVLLWAASRERGKISTVTNAVLTPYYLWAGTFFVLAASLLYVGWQVIGLILGRLSRHRSRVESDGNISPGNPIGTRALA